MDPNLLEKLALNGNLNQEDSKLVKTILDQFSKGKQTKMTIQQRNNLMAHLSSIQNLENNTKNIKDIKDMDENEKKAYKDELKKKMRNMQDKFKNNRLRKSIIQNKLEENESKKETNGLENNIENQISQLLNNNSSIDLQNLLSKLDSTDGSLNLDDINNLLTKNKEDDINDFLH
jgi:hypothetical protein